VDLSFGIESRRALGATREPEHPAVSRDEGVEVPAGAKVCDAIDIDRGKARPDERPRSLG